MQTNQDIDKLPPLLKRSKYLLIFVSAFLIIANFYFLYAAREHEKSYTAQQSQATWFLFQLTKEFSELNSTLPFAAQDPSSLQRALLKYELTWSRFDLLITSSESNDFMALPGARTFFVMLFDRFQALEPHLEQIGDERKIEQISDEFSRLYMSMIDYVNANFRVKSPLSLSQMDQARALFLMQLICLLLLIVGVVLVAFILQKETLYHRKQSLTDPLTKLSNRLAFMEQLVLFEDNQKPFSLVLLDLNGFKKINDKFGHLAGDSALTTIADRLFKLAERYQVTAFRIGGDEFALVLEEADIESLNQLVEDIDRCFAEPVSVTKNDTLILASSIGISRYPTDSPKIHALISIADQNMYKMKFSQKQT